MTKRREKMKMKTADDYSNDILEAVDMACKNPPDLKAWRAKYGTDCLANAVTHIVRRAMKSAANRAKRGKK